MPESHWRHGWTVDVGILVVVMLVTGSINTLSTKWADNQKSVGKDNGDARPYQHPFVQALGMFFGEMLCLFAFKIIWATYKCRKMPWAAIENQKFNIFVFLPPALLDMTATSLMYTALNLTYPSSYQMLRGSVIIFTALLSVAFLGRYIETHMWVGISFVISGLFMVGIADIVFSSVMQPGGMNAIVAGDLLILIACVVTSSQMVYEEKYVKHYGVHPLQAVGCEGLCGFITLGLLLIPMYFITGIPKPFSCGPEERLEDVPDALAQMRNNPIIIVAITGNILSIAVYNFSGISVTKRLSATTRMVIDSLRTLIVWSVSLALGWQPLNYRVILIQLSGFVLLIFGMLVYNDLVFAPFLRRKGLLHPLRQHRLVTRPGNDSMQGTVHEANVEVENENDDDHDIYSDDRRTLTPRHLNAINQ